MEVLWLSKGPLRKCLIRLKVYREFSMNKAFGGVQSAVPFFCRIPASLLPFLNQIGELLSGVFLQLLLPNPDALFSQQLFEAEL